MAAFITAFGEVIGLIVTAFPDIGEIAFICSAGVLTAWVYTVPAAEDCCHFFESKKLTHSRLLYSGHNISVTYEERTGTTLATVLSQCSIYSVAISLKK